MADAIVRVLGVDQQMLAVREHLGDEGGNRIALLRQRAPTWLVRFPWLLSEADREALQRELLGATRERMRREFTEAIEALTAERLLVLVLEDLHWSDYSTLDLLSVLTRGREPARLLTLGTYRPADVPVSGHPLHALKQEFQAHGQCTELPLRFLTVAEVTQSLAARFVIRVQDAVPLQELGRLMHRSTDGNPLFMVMIVDYLVAQGAIGEVAGQWSLALLAETYARGGQADTGFTVLAEALAAVQATGVRFYEAELYLLKGELLQKVGRGVRPTALLRHECEECFRQAIAIARRQQAKSLELRATVSLSRLWQEQGQQAEARQILAEIYGWFTEGFDTADLQEARVLLAELA